MSGEQDIIFAPPNLIKRDNTLCKYFPLVALLIAPLAGCGLPAAGPTARQIQTSAYSTPKHPYLIIRVTEATTEALARHPEDRFQDRFSHPPAPKNLWIGPGDILQVSIWETGGSGLFAAAPPPTGSVFSVSTGARNATLQPVTVARDGYITLPFAGRIKAAASTLDQIRRRIEIALKHQAFQPQVMVQMATNSANVVAVGGEVHHPALIPLSLRGERLLDVLAAAGGARFPAYETYIRLHRKGQNQSLLLQYVLESPRDNIYIHPGDDIYVTHLPRTFTIFGAAGKVGHYPFDTAHLSLAEAIAKSGGLSDSLADPSGIFIFRYEPLQITSVPHSRLHLGKFPPVPVIYHLNLKEAGGFFLAQKFQMRDKDSILISNASGSQLMKLFAAVRGITGMIGDVRGVTFSNRNNLTY